MRRARPRVNGSCAFWKKLVLVRNTFPLVPHPLTQKPLPLAAGAGTAGLWAAVKNKGRGVFPRAQGGRGRRA